MGIPSGRGACESAACAQGISISLGEADRRRLEAIAADRNTPQKHVWRARIVLLTADGVGTNAIMAATGKSKTTVWRWQERFMSDGVDGLLRTGRGRRQGAGPGIGWPSGAMTLSRRPTRRPTGRRERWRRPSGSLSHGAEDLEGARSRAPSLASLQALQRSGLRQKLHDIVGLYVAPPAHAVVLSIDEKSQIQALDRTQPGLPLKKGRGAP